MKYDADLFGRVSTADTGERSELDFYETPRWMTLALLRHHPAIAGRTVFEPCSGRDAIADVLRATGSVVHTNDIDPRHQAQHCYDATFHVIWARASCWNPCYQWVVTNVAFDVAFPILKLAFDHMSVGIAMLLRKSFTEPTEDRGPWLREHPPTRQICLPRHSFRGSGSDTASTDWFIWERNPDRSLPPFVVDDLAEKYR